MFWSKAVASLLMSGSPPPSPECENYHHHDEYTSSRALLLNDVNRLIEYSLVLDMNML